jgi:predicted ATPase
MPSKANTPRTLLSNSMTAITALAVADELLSVYAHGVWLVELAALVDPTVLAGAVADMLGLESAAFRPPEKGAGGLLTNATEKVLVDFLRTRRVLLVLDNCEHLLPVCAGLVETLLRASPGLDVLATSREPLGVPCEAVWSVPPLGLPPAAWAADFQQHLQIDLPDSVSLFVERRGCIDPALN